MKKILAFLLLAASPAWPADAPAPVEVDPLAGLILQRIAAQGAPLCIAVAVVAETTRIAYACSKDAGPVALDRDTLFEIGSASKAFTGILLADLVATGKVKLDDPLAKYAPEGIVVPKRRGAEITLLDLATQTSGLPRLPPGMRPADPQNPYADLTPAMLWAMLERSEPKEGGDSRYEYSNFGFMLLSDALGRAGGSNYEEVLRERVLAPLGMASTSVRVTGVDAKRFAQGHDRAYQPVPHWDIVPALAGVGGLRSSIADMARFIEGVLGRRERPPPATFALATAVQRKVTDSSSIGLAWMTVKPGKHEVVFHNGQTAGFHSFIGVAFANSTGVVVLADSAADIDDLGFHLLDPTVPMKKARAEVPLDAEKLQEYVGRYELSPKFAIEVTREGARLFTQATNQVRVEVFAEAPDRFFLKAVDAQLVFERGADGKVNGLVLHQLGRTMPGRRLPD
jgi:CubicO group peptidase (beta-lactamase class C family)